MEFNSLRGKTWILSFVILLAYYFVSGDAYAVSTGTGNSFTAVNNLFSSLTNVLIGVVEFVLGCQFILHLIKLNNGQPGEKEKLAVIAFAMAIAPFVPAIVQWFYQLFNQSGGTNAQGVYQNM